MFTVTSGRVSGSSPRMRGKHMSARTNSGNRRIIPAHAGQTSFPSLSASASTDHPRACGANLAAKNGISNPNGSSPRMRGKHKDFVKISTTVRIIPAHAGQTCNVVAGRLQVTDHPRACGANVDDHRIILPTPGSSPRMRGKRACATVATSWFRIIPAHAGQTATWPASRTSR